MTCVWASSRLSDTSPGARLSRHWWVKSNPTLTGFRAPLLAVAYNGPEGVSTVKTLRLIVPGLILTVLLAACAPNPGVKSDAARVELGSIKTAFTQQAGQKPEVVLQGVIRSAQSTLDVAIYT